MMAAVSASQVGFPGMNYSDKKLFMRYQTKNIQKNLADSDYAATGHGGGHGHSGGGHGHGGHSGGGGGGWGTGWGWGGT